MSAELLEELSGPVNISLITFFQGLVCDSSASFLSSIMKLFYQELHHSILIAKDLYCNMAC